MILISEQSYGLNHFLFRPLIWLPCRKHILEIILKEVFFKVFGEDNSPFYSMFEKFRNEDWFDLELENYSGLTIRNTQKRMEQIEH